MTSIALNYYRAAFCNHCGVHIRVPDTGDDDPPPVFCNACYEHGDADMVDMEAANDGDYPGGSG